MNDLEYYADKLSGMPVYSEEMHKFGHIVSVYENESCALIALFNEGAGCEDIEVPAGSVTLLEDLPCEGEIDE